MVSIFSTDDYPKNGKEIWFLIEERENSEGKHLFYKHWFDSDEKRPRGQIFRANLKEHIRICKESGFTPVIKGKVEYA